MLFPMDMFECSATITIPDPIVSNTCSEVYTVTIMVIDGNGETVATFENNEDPTLTLGAGDYTIRYVVEDECGSIGTRDCIIRVADTQEPSASCVSHINTSIGGYGVTRIYNYVINANSDDNCGIDSIQVRRILTDSTYGAWGEYVDMTCEDVGEIVTVEMQVIDLAGNVNFCTASISVVDNSLPYCTGLEDLNLSCTDLPAGFIPTDTLSLQEAFGKPEVIDNCAAEAIELDPIFVGDECSGAGTITRRFLAVDQNGNVSSLEFIQVITIEANESFTLVFPADLDTDCVDQNLGMEIIGGGCAQLTMTYTDSIVEATLEDGEACMVIERTYLVINDCVYDGISDPIQITRDEDCNGEEGEDAIYVIAAGDQSFIDLDSTFTNNFPAQGTKGVECDGQTNPEGYLRAIASNGAWTYIQRVRIFDNTAPVLVYENPAPYCTDTDEGCSAMISFDLTIDNECTAAGGQFLLMVDFDRNGSPDMPLSRNDNVSGEFPNFIIEANLPIGEHNLIIRYFDGCNNVTSALVPVDVIDCSVPEPTCYSGLIVNLEEGADGAGTGVIVDATQLASCPDADCSGELSYSVNRIGATVSRDSTEVTLTCDDRYHVELEVYTWDNANNPTSVQPDGSIGGPNWRMCIVEVFVQDPNGVCPDCSAPGIVNLGGDILTPGGVGITQTEVNLTGTATNATQTNDSGDFIFQDMESGDYIITPRKDDDLTNGVTTLDIYFLQRHLLGLSPITDPYMLIAADVNNDGTISTIDMIIMRSAILGLTNEFPNNTSWRFFDASVSLAGMNVMEAQLPESIVLEDLTQCTDNLDFVGVKIGDLNSSTVVDPTGNDTGLIEGQGAEERSERESFPLQFEDKWLDAGVEYELPVTVAGLNAVGGMQFTLQLDTDAVHLNGVSTGLLGERNLGTQRLSSGWVSVSWNQSGDAVTDRDEVLFSLNIVPSRDVTVGEIMSLINNPTATEAYTLNDEVMDLHLQFYSTPTVSTAEGISPVADLGLELELMQNYPNPFVGNTTIRFYLPETGDAQLTIHDLTGRLIRTIDQEFPAGYNSVQLSGEGLPTGSLFYTLYFKGERHTRAMVRTR